MTAYVVSGLAQAQKAGYTKQLWDSSEGVSTSILFLHKALEQHPRMLPELRAYVTYALAESLAISRLDTLRPMRVKTLLRS